MSLVFKFFIFPEKWDKNEDKKKYFLFLEGTRQGLTLLLRISIKNEESGLRSSSDEFVRWLFWNFEIFIYVFFSNRNIF